MQAITAALKIPKVLHIPLNWASLKTILLTQTWAYLAIITAHSIWGINFVVAKLTLVEIPPMSLAFTRFVLAILLLSPFLLTAKKPTKIKKEDLPKLAAIGALMVTLNIAFFYAGLARTTVTQAATLTMTIPIISVLGGWWFFREKIYTLNLIGIGIGFIGSLFVIGLPSLFIGNQISSQNMIGNFFIVLASICWVIGATISKGMLEKYSTLTITAVAFLVGVISFVIPAANELLLQPSWPGQLTIVGVLGLLFISIASSICAYFLFEWGLGKLGVVKADLFQYIEPILATLLGVLILHEQLKLPSVLGIILIALGVYWSTWARPHHKHHKAHRT